MICCACNLKKCVAQFNPDCVTDDDERFNDSLSKWEETETTRLIHKIQLDGVNTIFCSGKMDTFCRDAFLDGGIHVFEGVHRSDLYRIAHLSGASNELLTRIDLYARKFIGEAGGFNYQHVNDMNGNHHLVSVTKTLKM